MSPQSMSATDGGRRLILAFDASCGTCRAISSAVQVASEQRLTSLGLNDPVVKKWRQQAYGDGAPWAPTLLELEHRGGDWKAVNAWTGRGLLAPLLKRLGPRRAYAVAGSLGRLKEESEKAVRRRNPRSLSRLGFMQVVAGAAAGVTMASGGVAFAAPVVGPPKGKNLRAASMEAMESHAGSLFDNADVRNVLGDKDLAEYARAAVARQTRRGGEGELLIDASSSGTTRMSRDKYADGQTGVLTENVRDLPGGATVQTDVLYFDGHFLVLEDYSQAHGGISSQAYLWSFDWDDPDGRLSLLRASANGRLDRPLDDRQAQAASANCSPGQQCDPCGGCDFTYGGDFTGQRCTTSSIVTCALAASGCVGCAGSCNPVTSVLCVNCILGVCGTALIACCDGREKACVFCGGGE